MDDYVREFSAQAYFGLYRFRKSAGSLVGSTSAVGLKFRKTFFTGFHVMAGLLVKLVKTLNNPSVILSLATFAVFLYMGRYDFDGHHDGVMLAAAIAVREGLFMHGQVYGHYGPITPWTQALFLGLPFSEAFSLRVWIAFHVALSAGFLSEVGKKLARQIGVSRWVGPLASVLWVFSSDSFSNLRLIPWSSIQVGTIILGFLLLLVVAIERRTLPTFWRISLGLATGFLLALAPFVRVNSGLALWGLLVLVLIVERAIQVQWFDGRLKVTVFVGFFGGLLGVLGALALTDSLGSFIMQSVIGPMTWGADLVENWQPISGLFGAFVLTLPELLLALSALAIVGLFGKQELGARLRSQLVLVQALLVGAAFFVASLKVTVVRPELRAPELVWFLIRDFLLERDGDLLFFLFAHLLLIVITSIILLRSPQADTLAKSPVFPALLVTMATNLSLLAQIYPVWDGRHIWWGTPVATLVTALIIAYFVKKARAVPAPFGFVVAFQVLTSSLGLFVAADQNRVPAPVDTVASDLMVVPEVATRLEGHTRLVSDPSFDSSNALFLVLDGDIAVVGGQYLSKDLHFTWWSREDKRLEQLVPKAASVVADNYFLTTAGYDSMQDFATEWNLRVVLCEPSVCLFENER